MVGAAAFTGAVTHTVSTIVIVSEMTGQVHLYLDTENLWFLEAEITIFLQI